MDFLLAMLIFLAFSVVYGYGVNPSIYISQDRGLLSFSFYGVTYFWVLMAVGVLFKKCAALSKIDFWVFSLLILLVL